MGLLLVRVHLVLKNFMKINIVALVFIFFFILKGEKGTSQYTELGFGGGVSTYWGDLNSPSLNTNLIHNSGMVLQLHIRKIFKKKFGAKASLSYGQVKGNDSNSSLEWQKLRNLSFKSSITELALMGEFFVFGYDMDEGSSIFLPYISFGVCGFRFDPRTNFRGNEVRLQPLGTEGQGMPGFDSKYNLMSAGLSLGGGAKIKISETINIGFESSLRRTLTDYLDDLSGNYVNYDDLSAGNGVLAASLGNRMNEYLGQSEPVQVPTGSTRGGAKVKDYYFMSAITINILMSTGSGRKGMGRGVKIICPKF